MGSTAVCHEALRSIAVRSLEVARNAFLARITPAFRRLYILGDAADWSLTEDAKELLRIAERLGIKSHLVKSGSPRGISGQVVFSTSQWFLPKLRDRRLFHDSRVTFAYFHGRPSSMNPEFAECLFAFKELHHRVARAQVSNTRMLSFLIDEGIPSSKLALIPIGIDIDQFPLQSHEKRTQARKALGIPSHAFVIGSFQKDGIGWGAGFEPKLIKGPDILLRVLQAVHPNIPELHVLLSGPARGYVMRGLEQARIPFTHVFLKEKSSMASLYQATDLTLVTSRDEGGPKAVLESMASGVPLVTTKVGQAEDLIVHQKNGWIAEIAAVDELAQHVLDVFRSDVDSLHSVAQCARSTAEANSYSAQDGLWREFFNGVIEW